MKSLSVVSMIFFASILASCAGTPTDTTGPASPSGVSATDASSDPDFEAKCMQRIKAGLANPNTAVIALSGDDYELQANVTTTDPDNGETASLNYVCKRDEDRAVTAKLIAN